MCFSKEQEQSVQMKLMKVLQTQKRYRDIDDGWRVSDLEEVMHDGSPAAMAKCLTHKCEVGEVCSQRFWPVCEGNRRSVLNLAAKDEGSALGCNFHIIFRFQREGYMGQEQRNRRVFHLSLKSTERGGRKKKQNDNKEPKRRENIKIGRWFLEWA